tara:strand:+ start:478 stop:702 length:225 start_codon:yes stop_codon:yes gene_type:complete
MNELMYWLDLIIPRFVTEPVEFEEIDGTLYSVGCAKHLLSYDDVDAIIDISSFKLFGKRLFPRVVGVYKLKGTI